MMYSCSHGSGQCCATSQCGHDETVGCEPGQRRWYQVARLATRMIAIYPVLTKPTNASWASGISLAIIGSPTSGSAVTLHLQPYHFLCFERTIQSCMCMYFYESKPFDEDSWERVCRVATSTQILTAIDQDVDGNIISSDTTRKATVAIPSPHPHSFRYSADAHPGSSPVILQC
jgi:hypothetical protein